MSRLKELEQRLREEPGNLGLRVTLAGALQEAGKRDDAIELYRSVAVSYRDQGRPQQAIAVCRSILALAPEDVSCKVLLASLLAPPPGPSQAGERPSRPTPPPLGPPPVIEPRPPPVADAPAEPEPRPTPLPLGPPPEVTISPAVSPPVLPMAATPAAREPARRPSPDDLTPLPAPLPHHVADPTRTSLPTITIADLPPSLREAYAPYAELAGIANAARQISASLIAAAQGDDEHTDEVSRDEPERATQRRISASTLDTIADPPPDEASRALGAELGDDDPTIPPGAVRAPRPLDHEKTEPRALPVRGKPPSIAPPSAATGPLAGAFFAPVPPPHRAAILQRFRRRLIASGTVVIRRGETGHGLVVVVRGKLELRGERSDGAPISLGVIGAGEFIGEASLLARAAAATQIEAAEDSEVMVLGAADFYEIVARFPPLSAELTATAVRRARAQARQR